MNPRRRRQQKTLLQSLRNPGPAMVEILSSVEEKTETVSLVAETHTPETKPKIPSKKTKK